MLIEMAPALSLPCLEQDLPVGHCPGASTRAQGGRKIHWQRLRRRMVAFALRYPRLVAGLLFMLFFTASEEVHYALREYAWTSPFWYIIGMGMLVGFFGSLPAFELIQQQRRLAQVELVHNVVTTLYHEINNPLTVIIGSAALMRDVQEHERPCVQDILASGRRIQEVMAKLSSLEQRVALRRDCGFEEAIDLDRSE